MPIDRCGYQRSAGGRRTVIQVRAAAKDFFLGRPVEVIEGPYEFNFDFVIALDTKNGLLFTFAWNLQD